jgi:hypothetical protein
VAGLAACFVAGFRAEAPAQRIPETRGRPSLELPPVQPSPSPPSSIIVPAAAALRGRAAGAGAALRSSRCEDPRQHCPRRSDYFSAENFKPDSVVASRQLAPDAILVFRASDEQKRTILVVLSGAAAAARAEDKKTPKPPPLTLELSYIDDPAHPDVFRIGRGQFRIGAA